MPRSSAPGKNPPELFIQHKGGLRLGLTSTRPGLPKQLGGLNDWLRHWDFFHAELTDRMAKDSGRVAGLAPDARAIRVELDTWEKLPRQKARLAELRVCVQRIFDLGGHIQQSLTPSPPAGDSLAATVLEHAQTVRAFAHHKLRFYTGLVALDHPAAAGRIKEFMNTHGFTVGGKRMVNVFDHHKMEVLDPLHLRRGDLENQWRVFAGQKAKQNLNEYDYLCDFLLAHADGLNFDRGSVGYMEPAEREHYRLRYGWQVGREGSLLYGRYRMIHGARGPRYLHHLDRRIPGIDLQCRWLPHTSNTYINPGRGELEDLVDGDLYVMDESYSIYTFLSTEFHTALLAGAPVMAAGIMVCRDGKVLAIDNKSGHYRPDWHHLHQAVCELEFNGVFAPDAFVCLALVGMHTMFFPVQDFIELGNQGFGFAPTFETLQRYYYSHGHSIPLARQNRALLPPGLIKKWQEPMKTWQQFLTAGFPKNMKRRGELLTGLLSLDSVPDLKKWKTSSSAGLLATRGPFVKAIDAAIEAYDAVRTREKRAIPFPSVTALEEALRKIGEAAGAWLAQKDGKVQSTRRPHIEQLRRSIEENLRYCQALRVTEPERLAADGIG